MICDDNNNTYTILTITPCSVSLFSTISTEVHPGHSRPSTKAETLHGGTSSGYESMLRDSEAGTSSGHEESGSESSTERVKGSRRNKGESRSSVDRVRVGLLLTV